MADEQQYDSFYVDGDPTEYRMPAGTDPATAKAKIKAHQSQQIPGASQLPPGANAPPPLPGDLAGGGQIEDRSGTSPTLKLFGLNGFWGPRYYDTGRKQELPDPLGDLRLLGRAVPTALLSEVTAPAKGVGNAVSGIADTLGTLQSPVTQGLGSFGAALIGKLLPKTMGPLGRGVAQGAAGIATQAGGSALDNLLQGRDAASDWQQHPIASAAAATAAGTLPVIAGGFARAAGNNLTNRSKQVLDWLSEKAGLTPKELTAPRAPQDITSPAQQALTAQVNGHLQSLTNTSDSLAAQTVQHTDLTQQLKDAQREHSAAIATAQQDQLQSKQTAVVNLQSQLDQSKAQGKQLVQQYTEQRNALQTTLDNSSGWSEPQKIALQNKLNALNRDFQGTQAQFASEQASLQTGLNQAKAATKGIYVDPDKLPTAAKVQGLSSAVDDAKANVAALRATQKRLLTSTPFDSDVQAMAKASGEGFTKLLLDPQNLQKAMALSDDAGKAALKQGVISQLVSNAGGDAGRFSPKEFRNQFLTGDKLGALRLALGSNSSTEAVPLETKLGQFANFVEDASKHSGFMSGMKNYAAHRLAFGVLLGTAGAAMGHANPATLAEEIGGAGAVMLSAHAIPLVLDKFLTNDRFRQGAMEWAQGPGVGRSASDAARYFGSYVHARTEDLPQESQ